MYSGVLPSVILSNKEKVNFCINSFYLRKALIYVASLSPLPKENLLHCNIVSCLDVISVGFYFLVYSVCLLPDFGE